MSSAVVSVCIHTRSPALEESIRTATSTFDVFSSPDGYGSHRGCWGTQGPALLDHRLALYDAERADGPRSHYLSAIRATAGLEDRGVRRERLMGHPDEEHAARCVDHTGRGPRLAERDRRER